MCARKCNNPSAVMRCAATFLLPFQTYLGPGSNLLQTVKRQGVDVKHRVRASASALCEGAGVDAERTSYVFGERSKLGGEEEDCLEE